MKKKSGYSFFIPSCICDKINLATGKKNYSLTYHRDYDGNSGNGLHGEWLGM